MRSILTKLRPNRGGNAAAVAALSMVVVGFWLQPAIAATECPAPHFNGITDGFRYGLPPNIEKSGLHFCGQTIPISRRDVRRRIVNEINYLLMDRRSLVLTWLGRADMLKPVIVPVLRKYSVPPEFLYLSAIESSYDGRALSSAGAFGYWQFIRATALCGPNGCDEYDWKMHITKWKDERGDLVRSTHSAARYLAWMNRVKKINLRDKTSDGFHDWLLAAAAYNAGPTRVLERLNLFGASSYWDVPLPAETERYVPRLIALSIISNDREFYGVNVPPRRTVAFDTIQKVRLAKDLSLAAMARLLGTTPRAVWRLNSQIVADNAVFPAKSGKKVIDHTIHVPKGAANKFMAQLKAHGYTKK